MSHPLRHGVLNVVGQTRLQDAFWSAQLAKHASDAASANSNFFLERAPDSATAAPTKTIKNATHKAARITGLQSSYIFFELRRIYFCLDRHDGATLSHATSPSATFPFVIATDHKLFDFVAIFQGSHEPTWLLSPPRPGFRMLLRIAVLRKNTRILSSFPPRVARGLRIGQVQLACLLVAAKLR